MIDPTQPEPKIVADVIESLRAATMQPDPTAFVTALESNVSRMITGRFVSQSSYDQMLAAALEMVRESQLARAKNAGYGTALRLLDDLKQRNVEEFESERPPLEAERNRDRASRYPAARAAEWPEIAELRRLAEEHPERCQLNAPAKDFFTAPSSFKATMGYRLPPDLLALYAACDGLRLSVDGELVFELLELACIEHGEAEDEYPDRYDIIDDGSFRIAIFRDDREQWWMVYEIDFSPEAKLPLDLRALLRHGIARARHADKEAMFGDLSWSRFFGVDEDD